MVINIDIPVITRDELPNFQEHKIQDPNEEIIDDPSTIFYDPNEKADFTYRAIPYITQDLDFSYVQPIVEQQQFSSGYPRLTKSQSYMNTHQYDNDKKHESVISPEYDDSLDGNSRDQSPRDTNKSNRVYDEDEANNFSGMNSRRDSLEFDDNIDERLRYPVNNFLPLSESTKNHTPSSSAPVYEPVDNTTGGSFTDDYAGLNLYEDNLLSEVRLNLQSNKGYLSDAESVKTYQDSGVYDDDLADSPKSLNSVARQLAFDDVDFLSGSKEKYTAFKTPMSSRQSSVESLILESLQDEIGGNKNKRVNGDESNRRKCRGRIILLPKLKNYFQPCFSNINRYRQIQGIF